MFLVYVFDGLRPELVREELMPNLSALRRRGTWFERSHCVFPSVTRVNAASLATGSYPAVHGIPSNTLYLPALDRPSPFATTGDAAVLRSLRQSQSGALLSTPTAADVLATAGKRTVAVSTGSPGSGYLLHPEAERCGGAVYHHSFSEPAGLLERVKARLGDMGNGASKSTEYTVESLCERVRSASRAAIEILVPEFQPDLLYFWCTVPDALHHRFGLGSAEATEGLRRVDQLFGELAAALDRTPASPLNVIVTADHGYATIDGHIDVAADLSSAGFQVNIPGGIFVNVDGGAAHLFCGRKDSTQLRRLVDYLSSRERVAALFTREPVPGALPLSAVSVDCVRAADVVACLAWRNGDNANGVNGFSLGGGGIAIGAGDHGGGSPFEMRNTMIAAGPAFRAGVSAAAAGVVDVAPTICRVLGIEAPASWSGRVLTEALIDGEQPDAGADEVITSEATTSGFATTVRVAHTGGTRYLSSAGRAS